MGRGLHGMFYLGQVMDHDRRGLCANDNLGHVMDGRGLRAKVYLGQVTLWKVAAASSLMTCPSLFRLNR